MPRRRNSVPPSLYSDYNELKFIVVTTLMDLVKRTRGNMLTFTSKKLAVHAGLPPQPILLTLIKDVLENLRREGMIRRYKRTSHGVKYMIDSQSPLWKAAKDRSLIGIIETPYLRPVLARMVSA